MGVQVRVPESDNAQTSFDRVAAPEVLAVPPNTSMRWRVAS
jgi:hypothetical protein